MYVSIQYLRAIAVFFVLLVHTTTEFGVIGVDIFFVISGLIMMHILNTRDVSAKDFFIARFLRIAPLYYTMMTVTLIIGMAYEPTIKHIIESFLFLKLHWHRPILTVGWTLEFEFLFYMSIVFVLLFTSNSKKLYIYTTILLLIGTILVDIIIYPQGAYGYFIEFWYGMTIYYLIQKISIKSNSVLIGGLIIGFVAGYFSMYTHDESNRAYLRFLTYGIPSFLIVFFALMYEKKNKLRKIKWLMLIGNASFSIYLSHLITLHLYYRIFNISKNYSLYTDIFSILLAMFIGILVYIFVEKRLNILIHKKILKRKIIVK